MIRSSHPSALKRLLLVVFGAVLLACAIGGWAFWPGREAVAIADAGLPNVVVGPQPVMTTTSVQAEKVVAIKAAAPVSAEPIREEPRKKPPQGKNHARQEILLAIMIEQLHAEAFQHFRNQPGRGFNRMMDTISVIPRTWKMPEWTSEELAKEPPPFKGAKDLAIIHRHSAGDFADSTTKRLEDRWQGMRMFPPLPMGQKKEYVWEIKSLDLVGLVMHDSPMVYISDKIPLAMNDLGKAPTREPDLFEMEGLEELANGKALYIRRKENTIRVLGPVHAAKACLKCHHDAKEGDLLGAFSYTLRPGEFLFNGKRVSAPSPIDGVVPGFPDGAVIPGFPTGIPGFPAKRPVATSK